MRQVLQPQGFDGMCSCGGQRVVCRDQNKTLAGVTLNRLVQDVVRMEIVGRGLCSAVCMRWADDAFN